MLSFFVFEGLAPTGDAEFLDGLTWNALRSLPSCAPIAFYGHQVDLSMNLAYIQIKAAEVGC